MLVLQEMRPYNLEIVWVMEVKNYNLLDTLIILKEVAVISLFLIVILNPVSNSDVLLETRRKVNLNIDIMALLLITISLNLSIQIHLLLSPLSFNSDTLPRLSLHLHAITLHLLK